MSASSELVCFEYILHSSICTSSISMDPTIFNDDKEREREDHFFAAKYEQEIQDNSSVSI